MTDTAKTLKMSAAFVLGSQRIKLEYEATPVERSGLTIDLKPIKAGSLRHSITGSHAGGFGQCTESIREAAKAFPDNPLARDVILVCEIWDRIHLNDMSAGTRAQNAYLETVPARDYDAEVAALKEVGLEPDKVTRPSKPYSYGSAWLYAPTSKEDVRTLRGLLTRLDGARISAPVEREEGDEDEDGEPVEPGEAEFSNSDDTIDSRDVIARIEVLRDYKLAGGKSDDALAELAKLESLEEQASGYAPDWGYGETLIRDSYFEDYAREFAEDCEGKALRESKWPFNCIDWAEAAKELQGDYTAVEFDGVTYWVR